MAKQSTLFTSLLLGAVGGAAAALFLASETGKKVKKETLAFAKAYSENPDKVNEDLVNKAQDLKQQAVERYSEVKEQFDTGELTVSDLLQVGKEKAQTWTEHSLEKLEQWKSHLTEVELDESQLLAVPEEALEDVVVETDIEITL